MDRYRFLFKLCIVLTCSAALCNAKVVELDESNWQLMLQGEWMIEFFAPWCPACKNLENVWNEYSIYTRDLDVKCAKVDVTVSPGLSGRFFVTALPTIFHVKDGEFRQYRGSRDLNSFITFLENKKWSDLEPVSSWKKPDSIPMSILSLFFRFSNFIKDLNNLLLKEYGLPVWGSYAMFALATILLGSLLGLVLVCIIDFIFPPKTSQRQTFTETKVKEGESLSEEEIKGDELDDEEQVDEDTSEGEKYSNSEDSDAPESDKKPAQQSSPKKTSKASPQSSPDVRKRKPRKAD